MIDCKFDQYSSILNLQLIIILFEYTSQIWLARFFFLYMTLYWYLQTKENTCNIYPTWSILLNVINLHCFNKYYTHQFADLYKFLKIVQNLQSNLVNNRNTITQYHNWHKFVLNSLQIFTWHTVWGKKIPIGFFPHTNIQNMKNTLLRRTAKLM